MTWTFLCLSWKKSLLPTAVELRLLETKPDSHQGRCGYRHCGVPSANSRDQQEVPAIVPFPRIISQLPNGRFHSTMEVAINQHPGYGFAFPAYSASVKNTIYGLTECLIPVMVFYTAFLLNKKLTSQQMKCSNGPMLTEFTGLTMCPTILKWLAWQDSGMTVTTLFRLWRNRNPHWSLGNTNVTATMQNSLPVSLAYI